MNFELSRSCVCTYTPSLLPHFSFLSPTVSCILSLVLIIFLDVCAFLSVSFQLSYLLLSLSSSFPLSLPSFLFSSLASYVYFFSVFLKLFLSFLHLEFRLLLIVLSTGLLFPPQPHAISPSPQSLPFALLPALLDRSQMAFCIISPSF